MTPTPQRSALHPPPRAVAPDVPARAVGDFEALYRTNYPLLQRYVRRRLGDPHAVEDVVSETFLVAWDQRRRWRDRGLPVRAWLYRVATSRVARHLRRTPARPVGPIVEEPAAPAGDEARRELARAALASLPARLQDALALHHLEGLGVEDVARVLGCRPGTVKSRLHRGRAALRRELERRGWNR